MSALARKPLRVRIDSKPKNVSAPALYGFLASPYLVLLEADFLKKAVDYSDWFSHPCAQKDGRVRFESSSIGWIYMLRGGETRCSAVWSAHLFWVQRAIGSNPVTLMWGRSQPQTLAFFDCSMQDPLSLRSLLAGY
ncbi:hypothetical protein Salat_2987000 [Sesamum alatum]|uniref:Uncharacterized protein n=1 Tax=Sesamum alatum TaxID=300844 RepID=A0AAE2C7V0_9LAMI|nr:hypothetical protein Salat_2987000 [Sesamum alatum]